jgi:autophagy-related protein 33
LWTALVGLVGGQGVEYWYNGWTRFTLKRQSKETGYVEVESSEVNGEKVEAEMAREVRTQNVRTAVSLVGFLMGVVGIWGDGA